MNIIQRELDSAYHDSIRLRKNIIRTCKDHLALIFELINSSMNISTLINILQFSIINYEIVRKSFIQQQHQYQQNEDEIDDQYFIDRQYRRKKSSFNRRKNFRNRNDRFQTRRFKKCFVCEKSDCWSINHSIKKRKNSKKRFSDRHLEYKIRQEFDRRLN
jgi:tRNA C32,U32 (ribose-2'-O)-methylase TrmJ